MRNALAAPRIVARRANGRESHARAATSESVAAASCAWTGAPLTAPSFMALTASAAPVISSSARISGSWRWSHANTASSSNRNGAR